MRQNLIQKRNSASHYEPRDARQWPRFPKLRPNYVPDDDVLCSAFLFWFIVKG